MENQLCLPDPLPQAEPIPAKQLYRCIEHDQGYLFLNGHDTVKISNEITILPADLPGTTSRDLDDAMAIWSFFERRLAGG